MNFLLTWLADYGVSKIGTIIGWFRGLIASKLVKNKIEKRIDREVGSQVTEVEKYAAGLKLLYKRKRATKKLSELITIEKEIKVYYDLLKGAKRRLHAGIVG